jgi:hypothetical protein
MSEPDDQASMKSPETASDDGRAGRLDDESIPKFFATIHWKSPLRPNGYTHEDVAELNRIANLPKPPKP